jgi:tetratricopeptide (TPR) repeat protein
MTQMNADEGQTSGMKAGKSERGLIGGCCGEGGSRCGNLGAFWTGGSVTVESHARTKLSVVWICLLHFHLRESASSADETLLCPISHDLRSSADKANSMDDLTEAERQWREVTREVPGYRAGWRGLGETLLRGGRLAEAQSLAQRLMEDRPVRIEGLLLRAQIAQRLGRPGEARAALDEAAAEEPDNVDALRARCQFLFDCGAVEEAEVALRTLAERTWDTL